MTKQMVVKFMADKNGKVFAYRWSPTAGRWFRMGYDEAKLMVATGQAVEARREEADVTV